MEPIFSEFRIPKRKGGLRTIYKLENPYEMKPFEDDLIKKLSYKYPIPMAYVKGVSIEHHISHHNQFNKLMTLDITKFFDTILVGGNLPAGYYIDADNKIGIKQGSRIAPSITNAIFFKEVDIKVLRHFGPAIRYSRYADDILVSAETWDTLNEVAEMVEELAATINLQLNKSKTKRVDLDKGMYLKYLGYTIKKSKITGGGHGRANIRVTKSRKCRHKHWAVEQYSHYTKIANK